jgi:hypothetical protein
LGGSAVWTQGALAKQVLSHTPGHFAVVISRWGLINYFTGWSGTIVLQISASRVARIIDVSHQHVFNQNFTIHPKIVYHFHQKDLFDCELLSVKMV